jgi:hypothetical protein
MDNTRSAGRGVLRVKDFYIDVLLPVCPVVTSKRPKQIIQFLDESIQIDAASKIGPAEEDDLESGPTEEDDLESGPTVEMTRLCEPVFVLGRKKRLTQAQFNVVKALLEAGESGLSKDELECICDPGNETCHDGRKILNRLIKKDSDWARVIQKPGIKGRGYRILDYAALRSQDR